MRPRRFPLANTVYRLPGGTEDNDLWVEKGTDGPDAPYLRSVWVPTKSERQAIADGQNISLWVWSHQTYPVGMSITPEQPGKS